MTIADVDQGPQPVNTHAALNIITEITSTRPAVVGKTYDLDEDGGIVKSQVANITQGSAVSFEPNDVNDFCRLLEGVANSRNKVLTPSLWHGDNDGQPFDIVSEAELSRLTGHPIGSPELAGILTIDGRHVAARLKRGLDQTPYMLCDWDNAPGIPDDWKSMRVDERVKFMSEIIPGFDTAERVDLYGSSARIIPPDGTDRGPSHSWMRVSHPQNMDAFKANIRVDMVLKDLAFKSPRFSRREPGTIIGHAWRTVMDLATLDAGRVVFCSVPEISTRMREQGYTVRNAGIVVVNRGGGALDISGYVLPDGPTLERYSGLTGERITFTREGGNIATHSRGALTLQSEIEVRGVFDTLENWLASMPDGGQLRCEAPIRGSNSEAAFIRRTGNGLGFVHDIGNGTTYHLDVDAIRNADVAEVGARLAAALPAAAVVAAVAERAPQRAAEAVTTMRAEGERAQVICAAGIEHLIVERVLEELPRLNPPMFRHAGGLVYVSKSREIRMFDSAGAASIVKSIGMERVKPLFLGTELAKNLDFVKVTAGRRRRGATPDAPVTVGAPGLSSIDVPKIIVGKVMETTMDTVPTISGIISTPTMRPDGSLMLENGFDGATGFWLDHDLAVDVPETPTKDQAIDAFNVLLELLEGFPMDSMSETVAVATMMGAVLRPAFPTMPGLMIEAPTAGSGKSYLTKVMGYLAHGRVPAVSNWPKGEEFAKHLHSVLVAGVPFIGYDNANGVEVGGETICTMLTEPEIRVRILGETKQVLVPTAGVVLVVNGNHPRITEDATQRFISCYINPTQANPRERAFASDPLEMLRADRGRYVGACLTIARAYLAAGSPGAVGYGSFDRWSRLVRSSLMWIVGEDVLTTTRQAMEDDPELQRIVSVVGLIAGAVGLGEAFTVASLLAAIQQRDAMQLQSLAGYVGASSTGGTIAPETTIRDKAGRFFRDKMRDRTVTVDHAGQRLDVRLVRDGTSRTGVTRWRLTTVRVIGVSGMEGD